MTRRDIFQGLATFNGRRYIKALDPYELGVMKLVKPDHRSSCKGCDFYLKHSPCPHPEGDENGLLCTRVDNAGRAIVFVRSLRGYVTRLVEATLEN